MSTQDSRQHLEKRAEPRFFLNMPSRILLLDTLPRKSVRAEIEDISLYGIKCRTPFFLEPGQHLGVNSDHLGSMRGSMLLGRVRWIDRQIRNYVAGIKLLQKNNCSLSLEQVSKSMQQFSQKVRGRESARISPCSTWTENFAFQLFWGLFFEMFSEKVQNNLVRLNTDLSLNSHLLDEILSQKQGIAGETENNGRLLKPRHHLGVISSDLKRLTLLFKAMQEENLILKGSRDDPPGIFDLGRHVQDRLRSFQDKLSCLLPQESDIWDLDIGRSRKLPGRTRLVDQGLDLLFLHAYQCRLYCNAPKISIRLYQKRGTVHLEFGHSGSGILHRGGLVDLDPGYEPDTDLHPWDARQLQLLHQVLFFFLELEPGILVRSEPGNNLIALRLSGRNQ